MITVRGKVVTFTGKDQKQLLELATTLKVTPQEALIQALEYQIGLVPDTKTLKEFSKLVANYKKTNKRSK